MLTSGRRRDPVEPVHGAIRALDQIRREQRGDGGNRHGNGIEKIARHLQGQAQRGDDERKLADLRQPHADAQGSAGIVAAEKCPEGTGQHLADDHGQRDDHHGLPMREQHLGINQQPDGHEENGAEHVAHRFQQRFDAVEFPRLGDHRANDERPQRDTVAQFRRQQGHAETQAQHGDDQHLVALEPGHVAEQTRHGEQAGDQRHRQEDAQLAQGHPHVAHAQLARHGDARQQRDHGDAQNVLNDQDAEDELREALLHFAQLAQAP